LCPPELGGSKSGKGRKGNRIQAIILHLVENLPKQQYILYLDNLFTSYKLFTLLRDCGYDTIGTYRVDLGVLKEFKDMKRG
jgi:hypothetical protein